MRSAPALILLGLAAAAAAAPSRVIEIASDAALLRAAYPQYDTVIAHYSVNKPLPNAYPGDFNAPMARGTGGDWELPLDVVLLRGDEIRFWLELRGADGIAAELDGYHSFRGIVPVAPMGTVEPGGPGASIPGAVLGGSVSLLVFERNPGRPALVLDSDGSLYANSQTRASPSPAPAGSLEITNGAVSAWIGDDGLRQVHLPNQVLASETAFQPAGLRWQGPQGQTVALLAAAGGDLYLRGRNFPDDTDGDGLPDAWEEHGVLSVDLPAMGANPFRKHVFLEIDWMLHGVSGARLLRDDAVQDVAAAFAQAPVANPDGSRGITLVADYGQGGPFTGGNQVAGDDDLNPPWNDFEAIQQFHPDRERVFHYCIFARKHSGGSSSGFALLQGQKLMVTLGDWFAWDDRGFQAGTLMHELGHNLGLDHGGPSSAENYKPNYLSIMSYNFQLSGIPHADGNPRMDYSRFYLEGLDEASLNETFGVRPLAMNVHPPAGYGTRWLPGGESTTLSPLDWNRNASLETGLALDLNGNGIAPIPASEDEWQDLFYRGGMVGVPPGMTAGSPMRIPSLEISEMTEEDAEQVLR